jgi:hypothetical protein
MAPPSVGPAAAAAAARRDVAAQASRRLERCIASLCSQ